MSVISTPAMNCPFLLRGGSGHFSSIPIELEVYLRVLEQLSHIPMNSVVNNLRRKFGSPGNHGNCVQRCQVKLP